MDASPSGRSPAIADTFAVSGSIEPTRLSMAYRAGLVVVALAMLLLPLVYLGIVTAAGAAVWWHVTRDTWLLEGKGGIQWRLLVYLAPAVIGGALVFFMVKPILARPSKRQEPVPIDPDAEPALFAFIHQICEQVRAPHPRLVQVDCQVNASASFMRGPFGIFRKNLVLTIGLPLVAGLTVRQLGGVLAHEFGHFAQGGGMRLTTIVRGINGWFARVVYQRDKWDDKLAEWSQQSDWRISIVLAPSMGAIWVSRRILIALMMAGHAISCFMMRQMEYDADSYEVKLSGSPAFALTSARLREMGMAAHVSYGELGASLATRRLPANLPRFVMDRLSRLPQNLVTQLRNAPAQRTGVFDTHPSDGDRIRAAMAAETPGVLRGGHGPAAALFRDFDGLSAAATRHHYEHDLGLQTDMLALVDTERAIRDSRTRDDHNRAMRRFFGQSLSATRPLCVVAEDVDSLDLDAIPWTLRETREAMLRDMDRVSAQYRQVEALEARREKAFAAEELLLAGYRLENGDAFELAEVTPQCAASTQVWAIEQLRALSPALDAFDSTAVRRLACGIRLTAALTDSPEPRAILDTLQAVTRTMGDFRELRRFDIARGMLEQLHDASPQLGATSRVIKLSEEIKACRARMREHLRTVSCPQWLSTEPVDVATWCGLSAQREAPSHEVLDRVLSLYFDLLGRLTVVALDAEETLSAV